MIEKCWGKVNAGSLGMWRLEMSRFKRFFKSPILKLVWDKIPLTEGSRVLEEGAGGSSLSLACAIKTGAMVYSLDSSQEALISSKLNLDELQRHYGSLYFNRVRGDVFKLPFRDSVYDLIMSNGLMEHFEDRESRCAILREARRCIVPGGFLLIIIPNNEHVLTRRWQRKGYPWLDESCPVREYFIGPKQLASDLEATGFEIICKDCKNPWSTLAKFPNNIVLRTLAYILDRSVPVPYSLRLKFGIYAVAIGRKLTT